MADATVTGTDQRPSLASGAAFFGALVLAWATYMTLGFKVPAGGCSGGLCLPLDYTPTESFFLQVLLYSSPVYALVVWLAPWNRATAFLTIVYAGGGSLLIVFLLVRFGPFYAPPILMSAALGTFLIAYGIFACPDPLKSSPSMIDS